MAFSTFSKEFTANMYTAVENQFITKFLPQADGDAVRVYLYGLYLCQCAEEFDAASAAKLLHLTEEKLAEIYDFWEECDLVHVLSRKPLFVQYLPVNAAVSRPRTIRPEKYAQFNRELYKLLQKAGREFKPYEMQRILAFLEREPMEQQAFLLITEYCVKKDGEKLSVQHILNKAEKMCREHKYTYEAAEREFNDYHEQERELSRIFSLLSIRRKAAEEDYDLLRKWAEQGFPFRVVLACAESIKRGSMLSLDHLLQELREKHVMTQEEAAEYLAHRAEAANVVHAVAKRLGIKVENPRPYAEKYAEKWLERGYSGESLSLIASLCLDLRYGFGELDALLDTLYAQGIVDEQSVKDYCAERNRQIKLLQSLQAFCGVQKKTQTAFDMLSSWKAWNFSDEMILEAAKRSAAAQAPLPYINKLLSEWKRLGIFTPQAIEEHAAAEKPSQKPDYRSEAAIAADKRSERERRYARRREAAIAAADRARAAAEEDETFREAENVLKRGEIELAKAEVYAPESLPAIRARLSEAKKKRKEALMRLHIDEGDLLPRFQCSKCSDTGFLPNGAMCDCDQP